MNRRSGNARRYAWFLVRIGHGSRRIALKNPGRTTVGRRRDSTIRVKSPYCSRSHCCIVVEGETVRIIDENTSNGTYVNGQHYKGVQTNLKDNDIIGIGTWMSRALCSRDASVHMYTLKKIYQYDEMTSDSDGEVNIDLENILYPSRYRRRDVHEHQIQLYARVCKYI